MLSYQSSSDNQRSILTQNLAKPKKLNSLFAKLGDILALVPSATVATTIYLSDGERIVLPYRTSYILRRLAASVDKSIPLIRRRMATELNKRRNLPLPLSPSLVLMPIECAHGNKSSREAGYINVAHALLITATPSNGTRFTLSTGAGIESSWRPPVSRSHLTTARALHYRTLWGLSKELANEQNIYILSLSGT